ncbi:Nudix family hydrolase [Marinobacter bryozoorum]|uniref:Nudix family hydrolase n=1 Tax=Marinobacter bryozoorum TaxID=256324 RepID=UPI0020068041|nr:Nudix family hydrolase [Marinobacter bryozoorum]MCK7543880.1 Nudix family hydrolase [Marinobacter bryozoorum]
MTSADRKVIHVAVGVIWRDGCVLIARRPEAAHQGGLLEFPGGKVEPGETVQQALVRELLEETAITVCAENLQPLIGIRHDYGDKEVFLDVWAAEISTGEPRGLEGQPVFWMAPGQLQAGDFPAANRPIISAVRLPGRLAISGDEVSPEAVVGRLLDRWSHTDTPLAILRLPSMSARDYADTVRQCLRRLPGASLMVHDRPELLADLPVAGVHLSWRRAAALKERPVPADCWFGVSCHSSEELAHAAAVGADYATLGPVLPTPSHPGNAGTGWEHFADMAAHAVIPVYALGGVGPGHLQTALQAGGQGIAGISWWWPARTTDSEAR